jgi:fumarylacetoacetase
MTLINLLNDTHDARLTSWVASANGGEGDFPVQNLPHGVFRRRQSSEAFRGGVAIGDQILDLQAALRAQVFVGVHGVAEPAAEAASAASLNGLMAMGPPAWSVLRRALSELLRSGAPEAARLQHCLVPQADAAYAVPARIGDYTDFFTSYPHMVNTGQVLSPGAPPLPNFKWLPIAYHGRASSVEVSGAPVIRPRGQWRVPGAEAPAFGPTARLDYELELGAFVGPGNARGECIGVGDAEQHLFGLCLLNDWSARDVQGWESLPLGPFLAKNFLTTVSPWVVTLEALAPFRAVLARGPDAPAPLPNLRHRDAGACHAFDIELEAWLHTADEGSATRLSRSNARHGYWSLAQMVAHHTEGGCNLQPGDLLGTGTLSGPAEGEQACLMELSHGGRRPVALPGGASRSFLEDGDTVTLRAWCAREGRARIGFGDCVGTVLPARA